MEKKKLVYISHPSSGKLENTLDVENIIRKLLNNDEVYNKYCFVSPIHTYGFMYNDTEYNRGLSYCTDLLMHCDEMWVFGDWKNSKGCTEEVKLATKLNIPIIYLTKSERIDFFISKKLYENKTNRITPCKINNKKENICLYACIRQEHFNKIRKDKDKIKNLKFYDDIAMALNSIKNKKKAYAMIEIEIKRDKELDINNNKDATLYEQYVKNQIEKGRPFLDEKDAFKSFINDILYFDRFSYVKRTITSKSKIFNHGVIGSNNKNVYKILNTDCIVRQKVYNNYRLNDKNRFIVCGTLFF